MSLPVHTVKTFGAGKPEQLFSQSPGAIAGFGANHHLRQVLAFLDMPVVQQPEVYLSEVHTLLRENGKLKDDTLQFLQTFIDKFVELIKKHQA